MTRTWAELAASGATGWPDGAVAGEFDVASMLAGVRPDDLTVVADDADAARLGAVPAYMFLTWECLKAVAANLSLAGARPRSVTGGGYAGGRRDRPPAPSSRAVNGSGPKRAAASTARSAM